MHAFLSTALVSIDWLCFSFLYFFYFSRLFFNYYPLPAGFWRLCHIVAITSNKENCNSKQQHVAWLTALAVHTKCSNNWGKNHCGGNIMYISALLSWAICNMYTIFPLYCIFERFFLLFLLYYCGYYFIDFVLLTKFSIKATNIFTFHLFIIFDFLF